MWLIGGIIALVAVNVASDPAFLKITVQDGHLYGVGIDAPANKEPSFAL